MTQTTDSSKLSDLIIDNNDVSIDEKVKDFSAMLDDIESLSTKQRKLWREIYENSIIDRQNAYAMFIQMCRIVQDISSEHAIHGRNISSYLERMNKANDQLLKLSELIQKAKQEEKDIDPEDLWNKIKK